MSTRIADALCRLRRRKTARRSSPSSWRAILTWRPARRSSRRCRRRAPTSSSSACRFPTRWPMAWPSSWPGSALWRAARRCAATLGMVEDFRRKDEHTPDRADGLLQPHLYLWRRRVPRCRQGSGRRWADHRRPAARGRRRTVHSGAQGRAQLHPPDYADDRRQAPAGRAQEHIGLCLLRVDDRRDRRGDQVARAVGDAVERIKSHTDLPVAVGFGIKTAEDAAESASMPTASWWARCWSMRWRNRWSMARRPTQPWTRCAIWWPTSCRVRGESVHRRIDAPLQGRRPALRAAAFARLIRLCHNCIA